MSLKDDIAKRGMFFMYGKPPKEDFEPFIVYTGGCFPYVIHWREDLKKWCHHSPAGDYKLPFEGDIENYEDIICWMRLPHPAFWLEIEKPENFIKTKNIFHEGQLN